MYKAIARFPKTTYTFHITQDEVPESVKKKLSAMGWPNFWVTYSFDKKLKLKQVGDALFEHLSGEFGDSFPLSEPTEKGRFLVSYSVQDNSITLEIEGEFLVFNGTDKDANLDKIDTGYITAIQILDSKGKPIKVKDSYGTQVPLEATVVKSNYGVCRSFPLSVHYVKELE